MSLEHKIRGKTAQRHTLVICNVPNGIYSIAKLSVNVKLDRIFLLLLLCERLPRQNFIIKTAIFLLFSLSRLNQKQGSIDFKFIETEENIAYTSENSQMMKNKKKIKN